MLQYLINIELLRVNQDGTCNIIFDESMPEQNKIINGSYNGYIHKYSRLSLYIVSTIDCYEQQISVPFTSDRFFISSEHRITFDTGICYDLNRDFSILMNNQFIKLSSIVPTYHPVRINQELNNNKESKECNHDWTWYHGFTDSFEYCKKCDKRR